MVFGPEGPLKSDYRRFNIDGRARRATTTARWRRFCTRRYARVKQGEVPMPDVLFIDGGRAARAGAARPRGARRFRASLVGVAKGQDRKPGSESLYLPEREAPLHLPPSSPALHLIQQLRDEAHRFAITGHRARRQKARTARRSRTSGTRAEEAARAAAAVRRLAGD